MEDMAETNLEKPLQFGKGHTTSGDEKNDFAELEPRQSIDPYCTNAYTEKNHVQNGKNTNIIYKPQPNAIVQSTNDENRRVSPRVTNNNGISMVTSGILKPVKTLDANRYATKKTIAQGMLDIALLTANASQLKYILQVGKAHEFYTLMLTLISLSIGLQVLHALICLSLGINFNINKDRDWARAQVWNDIGMAMILLTVLTNIAMAAFGMSAS